MCSSLSLLFVGVFALGLVQAGARHAVYRAGRVPMQKLQLGLGRLIEVYRHVEVRKVPLWPWALPREEGGSRVARILAIPIGWLAMYAVPTALAFGLMMTGGRHRRHVDQAVTGHRPFMRPRPPRCHGPAIG